MSDDELKKIIRGIHFEKKNRIVKKDGKVRFKGRNYHISKKLKGTTVEMRVTSKGIEAEYGGKLIKRWKYLSCSDKIPMNVTFSIPFHI
jgi:hypothetical protein